MDDEFRRILFSTDFSETSETALRYATKLARAFAAELHLFHAIVPHDYQGRRREAAAGSSGLPAADALGAALSEEAGQLMAELVAGGDLAELEVVRVEQPAAAAAPAIVDYSVGHGIDLVVMATHGRRGVRRLFLGSVAEEVVRHSSIPVLTVGPEPRWSEASSRGRLLVAVDFGALTERLLGFARTLAVRTGASIHLLHAVELPAQPLLYDTAPAFPQVSYPEVEQEVRGRLEDVAAGLAGLRVSVEVARGAPAQAIADWCEEHRPDLVLVGNHRRTGLERFLLGSVTEQVVNRIAGAVLTVPAAEE